MGVYLPNKRLPDTYQEVEYIQSSGTQRIDTGLKPTDATFGFKGKVNMTAASGEWNIISINGTSTTDYSYRYSVQGSGTQWQTSNIMTSPSGWANVGTVATGTDYEFSYNYNSDRKFTVNGTDLKTGLTASTYSSYGVNWNIFCAAAGTGSGSYSRYGSFKLYYLQIYQGTTLVRDFIPCYRKSDTEIGLYDLVNNQFYTNSGSGTFTKGSDVVMTELKNAYIGEVWTPTANTLLYLPLESDIVDKSGQATTRVFSSSGISYTTVGGVPSIHIGTTGGILLTTPNPLVTTSTANQTISVLVYVTSQTTSARRNIVEFAEQNKEHFMVYLRENQSYYSAGGGSTGDDVYSSSGSIIANKRNHIVVTNNSSGKKMYINGSLVASGTGSSTPRGSWPNTSEQNQTIFNSRGGLSSSQGLNGNARELIMEDKLWSDEDIANYYTWIKTELGF